jgi:hypothetical protein
MERSKADDRSAYAQATKRRDGAMREMLGMGAEPVGHAEGDKPHKPQESTSSSELPAAGTAPAPGRLTQ